MMTRAARLQLLCGAGGHPAAAAQRLCRAIEHIHEHFVLKEAKACLVGCVIDDEGNGHSAQANSNRPLGSGMGRLSSWAVSSHSAITVSTLASAS